MSRFGHNLGYVDELYKSFRADPNSVSEAWREFFKDYVPPLATHGLAPERPGAGERTADSAPPAPSERPEDAHPLLGISGKIAENMTESLRVPTATSVRKVPVKILEENRRILNQHQSLAAATKVSFTHIIAWALVRSLLRHPAMNATFNEIDGKPHRIDHGTVNLGLAIDVERKGERILLVPGIRDAGALDFPQFLAAYDDLIQRTRKNELTLDDYQGITVTLTNPGMIGTALSVPRLMQGQATIIGVGSIGLPAEYSGMAPEVVSQLGISKVMMITSTYDHRVIQGAESGRFLATLQALLQGEEGFYADLFQQVGVPREPVAWSPDSNPGVAHAGNTEAIAKQAGVLQFIRAFRVRGHLWADLDPLGYAPEHAIELELSHYGLTVWDLDREFIAGGLGGRQGTLKLREIVDTLQDSYCRHVGVEYMHMQNDTARHWIQERVERLEGREPPARDDQIQILKLLNTAEAFETFLHTNYVGQKRFSLEGAETLIPMLDFMLRDAAAAGVSDVVMGMAHRGRLNVLAHIVGKPYGKIFGEFEEIDPHSTLGSGDVKYHLGARGEYTAPDGTKVQMTLASNPSHLEAVNPVVEGMARARQDRNGDAERRGTLPVLIHGDAAFAGQGVVAETLNLSQLQGYRTGGTIHVIINNQIGFTTGPGDARSSKYATDVAKMVGAPIFHVNGDQPEEAVRVIRHAMAFRQRFKADAVVDLICYRRWGHNEGDDPSYTHPILYAKIKQKRSVRKLYTERLLRRGDFDIPTAEKALEDYRKRLRTVHDEVRAAEKQPASAEMRAHPAETAEDTGVATAVSAERLDSILAGLDRRPEGFQAHPKLVRQLERRNPSFKEDRVDWALAEALAFGSLAIDGTPVRLSGEDSGRGTFSQRHAILYDHRDASPWIPLANLTDDQAPFQVFDSLLSEFALLGYEYGYSVDHPDALVLWEAQFGDFVNGAQVIIDQFISSAEEKWGQRSSLVMLLPHGYEGQGPEHSSARLERFLQLAAQRNFRIAYPSTPAQYFHLLRRQALDEERKPLVVMTPKSLLRLPACVSAAAAFSSGEFECVLHDPEITDAASVRRVVVCTGKIYYELLAAREEGEARDIALCRIEQLYPFPAKEIGALAERYTAATEWLWVQEEPANMGAWPFVADRLRTHDSLPAFLYVGRARCASPATGSHRRHQAQQQAIVSEALAESRPVSPTRP